MKLLVVLCLVSCVAAIDLSDFLNPIKVIKNVKDFIGDIFMPHGVDDLIVKTTSGPVQGINVQVLDTTVRQFLNIPYAEPPVGKLRFAKPEPLKHPKQLIDGTKPGNSCLQPMTAAIKGLIEIETNTSEDCLVLNVWSPKTRTSGLKPVMLWIHGGGLTAGSSFERNYNGSALATEDVVVVSVNYRLGWLGFLYANNTAAPGNVGLFDQVLAMKWVRDNIHAFGGDRDRVTIFGESAGGHSVSAQLLSPHAKGLFRRAIMVSGAQWYNKRHTPVNVQSMTAASIQMAAQFNCTGSEWLECLRAVDGNKIKDQPLVAIPLLETEFLPMSAQKAFETKNFNKDLDVISGVTQTEGQLLLYMMTGSLPTDVTREHFRGFATMLNGMLEDLNVTALEDLYVGNKNTSNELLWAEYAMLGDLMLNCPTYLFAKNYAINSRADSVYHFDITYQRTYPDDYLLSKFNVTHGADLPFYFGLPLFQPTSADTETDRQFSRQVMKMWSDFAKTGKPSNIWPKLVDRNDPSHGSQIFNLNPNTTVPVFRDLYAKSCDGLYQNYYN